VVPTTENPAPDVIGADEPIQARDREKAPRPADYGKNNKLFTQEAAEKAREILRRKLAQLNAGLDPELMQAGMTLAGYHVEAGARTFVDFARALVADLGEGIKPYLRSLYEAVRHWPGLDTEGMSSPQEVEATHLDRLDAAGELAGNPLAAHFLARLRAGEMRKDGAELKAWMRQFESAVPAAADAKRGQEAFELALGLYAAEIATSARTTAHLRRAGGALRAAAGAERPQLDERRQPGLLDADSAGLRRRPGPRLAPGKTVSEETAGNGLLLIAAGGPANAVNTRVNELNDVRAANLRAAGYAVTQEDAAKSRPVPARSVQVVMLNRPFGHMKDADGKNTETRIDGYVIRRLDHLLAARALEGWRTTGRPR